MATLTIAPPAERRRRNDFEIIQPIDTFTGSPIEPLEKGLPKQTQSICPECLRVIDARLFEEDGAVYMEKTCLAHGEFRDKIYSDARLYLKMEQWEFGDNRGLENPAVPDATRCPDDCGLCSLHTSHTVLSNVDLTNCCNLTCPVCFANANVAGYLYEPSFEQVTGMLEGLRAPAARAQSCGAILRGRTHTLPAFYGRVAQGHGTRLYSIQRPTTNLLCGPQVRTSRRGSGPAHSLFAIRRAQ